MKFPFTFITTTANNNFNFICLLFTTKTSTKKIWRWKDVIWKDKKLELNWFKIASEGENEEMELIMFNWGSGLRKKIMKWKMNFWCSLIYSLRPFRVTYLMSFWQGRTQEGLDPPPKKFEPQREHGSKFFGRGSHPPGYAHAFWYFPITMWCSDVLVTVLCWSGLLYHGRC